MSLSRRFACCALAIASAVFSYADPSVSGMASEPAPGMMGPVPGTYADTQVLLPVTASSGPVAEYRFEGQSSWYVFERPLYLSAFAGEVRRYSIEYRPSGTDDALRLSYVIDRRAPPPPAFTVPSGDVGQTVSVEPTGSGQIWLSVDGAPFEAFDSAKVSVITAPSDATRVVAASAYAVDEAGNASRTAFARWRLAPAGLLPSNPFRLDDAHPAIALADRASGLSAEIQDLFGSARVMIRVPDGAVPLAAVNAEDPFGAAAAYAVLSGPQSLATFVIPFPWGYDREVVVHYGYAMNGAIFVAQEPLRLSPRFPAEDPVPVPISPVSPSVHLEGDSAVIDWPENPWATYVSIDGAEYFRYESPLRIDKRDTPIGVRYYALGQNGARSDLSSLTVPKRLPVPYPSVGGIQNGASYGSAVSAVPVDGMVVRYSMVEGDAVPPPVTPSSPVLSLSGLTFSGREGRLVSYKIRLIADAPADVIPVERLLTFFIDREPPPMPEPMAGVPSYASSDAVVSFKPLDGAIFVSISEDGSGAFARYEGPMAMSGSDEGRKRYIIRAYSEDEFGNRSAEMRTRPILIDRSSLYADAKGRPGASGSPDDPIQYIDEAIAAALAAGKRFVYVRGAMIMRSPVVIRDKLAIVGGFDGNWNESPSAVSSIAMRSASPSGGTAFVVDGGSLSIQGMTVSLSGDGSNCLIEGRNGSITIIGSRLKVSGGIEAVALSSKRSSVRLVGSSLELSSTVTGRGLDVSGASLVIDDVSISCVPSVRLFDAVRVADAEASITALRLDAAPEHALSALSATRSTVSIERSVLVARGGASSCRLFNINASRAILSSVYIDVLWKGAVEVFNASNGSSIQMAYLTSMVASSKATFASSASSTIELRNSIVSFSGGDSLLVRSDTPLTSGAIASNCLWGISRYLEGTATLSTLPEFERYSAPARGNFIEDSAKTFYGSVKGLMRLSKNSACVDGGTDVGWSSALDLFGAPRVSGRGALQPDIGAEEL